MIDTASCSSLKGDFKIHLFLRTAKTFSQNLNLYLLPFLFEGEMDLQIVNVGYGSMID